MNHLWLLAKNLDTYFIRRLIEEVGQSRLNFINPWQQGFGSVKEGPILVRTSGVYGNDQDLHFLRQFFHPQQITNPLMALEICRSKKNQYQWLQQQGLSILPWLDLQTASLSDLQQFCQDHTLHPYLIKPHRGQGGWGIQVLEYHQLVSFWQHAHDREYLLQPFVTSAREYRYFFAGSEWGLCLNRSAAGGSEVANFAQGGGAKLTALPADLVAPMRQLQSVLKYGAVDILLTDQQYYIIDVNAVPGVEQLETLSGQNVLKPIVALLS